MRQWIMALALTACGQQQSGSGVAAAGESVEYVPSIFPGEVADDAHMPANVRFKCYGDGDSGVSPRAHPTCRVTLQGKCHDVGHEHETCFEQRTAWCAYEGSPDQQSFECRSTKADCDAMSDRASTCSEISAGDLPVDAIIYRRPLKRGVR